MLMFCLENWEAEPPVLPPMSTPLKAAAAECAKPQSKSQITSYLINFNYQQQQQPHRAALSSKVSH